MDTTKPAEMGHHALAHIVALIVLVALLGGSIFSLSVDMALHYAVIDAIMKFGTNKLPYIGVMSVYPSLSYWAAAGLGHLVGSGFVAMWLLCVAAIYFIYYCLFRLLSGDQFILPTVLFLLGLLALAPLRALFGFEVVANFFYAQLIGTAIYCGFLLYLSSQEKVGTWKNIFLTLVLAGVTMSIHSLPALEILATFGALLVFSIAHEFWSTRRFGTKAAWVRLAAFVAIGLCLIRLHPAFAALRQISQNDGTITVRISPPYLVAVALATSALLLHELIYYRRDPRVSRINFLLLSAIVSAIGLMLLQYLWLTMFHEGSAYAVKKHTYFAFTLCAAAWFYVVAYRIQPRVDRYVRRRSLPLGVLIPAASVIMTAFLLKGSDWRRPSADLYPIVHQIRYAENAVATSHPNFRPGNTAVVAPNVNFLVKYLISTSTFQMELSVLPAVSILSSTFDAKKSVEYAMVQSSSEDNRACGTRYAETSEFSIIPVSCLKQ
jgi:hypothetical protein